MLLTLGVPVVVSKYRAYIGIPSGLAQSTEDAKIITTSMVPVS